MSGIRNPEYVPMLAGGTVRPNRLVKIGAADNTVVEAAAVTDIPIGVSAQLITASSGDRVDVVYGGVYEVIAGASVTRGQLVVSDSAGAGVPVSGSAGAQAGTVGYALESAASGDLFSVLIVPHRAQQ